ncbi:MAG: dihydrolipoyl dehydrogenase [Conexivisphaerales archaeon]
MQEADIAIIGGGPGGYVCAIRAAQLGLRTIVIEKDRMGGECLNYGCIPSKALITAVKLYDKIRNAQKLGIKVTGVEVDMQIMQAWKKNVVETFVSGVEQLCKGYGAKIIKGEAELVAKDRIRVTNKDQVEEISTEKLVIATGSIPLELPFMRFDHRSIIDSRDSLELTEVPKRFLVVGGGAIGLEIASLYQKLGSQVTIVELTEQLLPGTDPEVVRIVQRNLERKGVKIYLKSKVVYAEKTPYSVKVTVQTPEGNVEVETDKILLSIGRRPNTDKLNLGQLGILTDQKGYILVNEQMSTSVEGVYAIGDVTGPPMLAHKASKQGIVAAEAAAGLPASADWKVIPDATFSEPEVANVGMTEATAQVKGFAAAKARFPFAALGRSLTAGETEGFVKLVYDQNTKLLLGAQIVGSSASDLISEISLAIEMGASVEDLAMTIHPHPTLPEGIMEAAEIASGKPIHQLRIGQR